MKIFILLIAGLFPDFSMARELDGLRDGSVWQSIAIGKMGELAFPGISKKWIVREHENGQRTLEELTRLSLDPSNPSSQSLVSLSLPIQSQFDCQSFTNHPFPLTAELREGAKGGYWLRFEMGFSFDVILIPSQEKKASWRPLAGFGIMRAPMGPADPAAKSEQSTGFIHHDGPKIVVLDPTVPPRFDQAVEEVILKWNRAIGFRVYEKIERRKINAHECLSSNLLCITWQGSQESLGWIGWGGITTFSFDPQDGSLLGGLITLQNLPSLAPLADTPVDIVEAYRSKKYDARFFAKLALRKEEFKKYRHPFEKDLFGHLLMHEIGHANGLKHDFSGSIEGTTEDPSASVMDYLPFPISHLVNDLEHRDLSRLSVIYQNASPPAYDGCSDQMEQAASEVNCFKGDWGEPSAWYKAITKLAEKGVYETVVEYLSGLPKRDYLSILAKFFSGELTNKHQQGDISSYLCSLPNRHTVAADLKEKYHVDLPCHADK